MSANNPAATDPQMHNGRPRSSTFARIAYTVFWLNVLALCIFILGLVAGWFWPEAESVRDGAYRVSLMVNTQEAKKDLDEVAETTQNIAETGASVVGMDTVQGQVRKVDSSANQLTLANEDAEYTSTITEATEIDVDGQTSLSELEVGDEIRVTMKKKGDEYFAYKISGASKE